MLHYDLVEKKVLSTTLLVRVGSVCTNTYLHPVLWGTQAVLHLLQLSFQMLHPQTVTQTLPLSNFKTRLCNLLLPTNKPAIENNKDIKNSDEHGRTFFKIYLNLQVQEGKKMLYLRISRTWSWDLPSSDSEMPIELSLAARCKLSAILLLIVWIC